MAHNESGLGRTKFTFTEKEMIAQTVVVVLIRGATGDDDGEPYYAYVAVRAATLKTFLKAQRQGKYNIHDFGAVLEAGKGDPAPDVRERMEQTCGFNHEKGIILSAK